jgi:Fe-S-cluster-containing dehydrogenase component
MAHKIYIHLDKCCGCQSCAAACYYGHHHQALLGHAEVMAQARLPLHCLHCSQPACAATCPNTAMQKRTEDGIVRRSEFMCVGCRSCAAACPFGVINHNLEKHLAPKCDLCLDLLRDHEIPRCVATCTSGALTFEEENLVTENKDKVLLSTRLQSFAVGRRR